MRRLLAIAAALVLTPLLYLGTTAAPAFAEVGDSGDNGCTTSTYSGDPTAGTWTRTYDANCHHNTTGTVSITWHNYNDAAGQNHIVWSATITTGALAGNACLEVALDWLSPTNGHSDVQFERNCYENSTYSPDHMPQDLNSVISRNLTADWPVRRLQIATYNPDDGFLHNAVCPDSSSAPADTNSDGECTVNKGPIDDSGWLHKGAAEWASKAAKIYRKTNAGNEQNNLPYYPADYTIFKQEDPDN